MRNKKTSLIRWLTPGLGIKRWLVLLLIGISILSIGIAQVIVLIYGNQALPPLLQLLLLRPVPVGIRLLIAAALGGALLVISLVNINRSLLAPYRQHQSGSIVDAIYSHQQRKRGTHVVAIGGGTGLPSVLRGMKHHTSNLAAIVTVADNGGSSGRLRRDLGILPPGDLRNNIAALADDEDLMTQLFQYRFSAGELDGHSFGNLLLTALSDITGSMEQALAETERVLAVQGSVLPATLDDVTLIGEVRLPDSQRLATIQGEEEITKAGGQIERVYTAPANARAYPKSVQLLLSADLVVLGPGSLFTSILPSLLVNGIAEAIRAGQALCVYVCNVATQPGETEGYTVADHVEALERHVGHNLFNVVLANNNFTSVNAGATRYVQPSPEDNPIASRYEIVYADLTDHQYPWRHDPVKLATALQSCYANYQAALGRELVERVLT
jgi:uncharacterized cofD-like protein